MSPASTVNLPNRLAILRDRAQMLQKVRAFFAQRAVTEVDCPCLSQGAPIDLHIDIIPVAYNSTQTYFLHSSPEYGMKRLLAEGMGDIYQLSHVFRDGEVSPKHNPEFMMAEWYRLKLSFADLIDETAAFIQLFLGNVAVEWIDYRQALLKYTALDYCHADLSQLYRKIEQLGTIPHCTLAEAQRDDLLNLLLGLYVEPQLGSGKLTVLYHYPATQAALARTVECEGVTVAQRFEIYFNGVELANGYCELTNPIEQRQRFEQANVQRLALGKCPLPLDEHFLTALERGLPPCCGVAVGFDRLMLLRHRSEHIKDVIPFDWHTA